ncbi:DUF3883 domain-containing protein [Chryseobacterium sp. Leaf394]|uniref:DUF3883 domain-containing protein n=1 Tax=Chryseobacterium sp. Leaf394 TaxID=1736361 RepID=UPI0006F74305|nr:DUF3883 domain-containing protein [Chryseobacterium sp. Leaf394]KQS93014.1 hypothetical protein ASG21_11455 [Chryseobacterium sp. Leaf394]
MNSKKVKEIITCYKRHFGDIHNEEIYKWRAVKCFQENWNIDAYDFLIMFDKSFSSTKNLLDSGKYFPKRMLHEYAKREPEIIRQLFKNLYNEDEDLIYRVSTFKSQIIALHNNLKIKVPNNYQDHRAILVYLCLRYPDIYYLFKFKMFKDFAHLVDYPFRPKSNDIQTVLEYLSLCDIIRAEVIKDKDLLQLHNTRIKDREYADTSYHILTQDIIYAAVKHIDKFESRELQEPASSRLVKVDKTIIPKSDKAILKGTFTNYIENEKEKKRIGNLGELLVLQFEQEKLNSLKIKKEPIHISKSQGDGLGYDILSFDENGNEIFIEVKTTVRGINTPFYITRNELEKSTQQSDNFLLYRLYEFDDKENKAKYYEKRGNLLDLCVNPILYRIVLEE